MHIQHLVLRDFRNYESLDLPLGPGLTAFIGLNGQGKTNLLEAVCFLASSKSHRTHVDRELIRWEQEFLCTRAEFVDSVSADNEAEMIVTRDGQKRAKFNGVERTQLSDWLGRLNLCGFFPEDVTLVSGRPSTRRQFLDQELSKLDPGYRDHWLQYRRVLSQRNALLREMQYRPRGSSSLPELSEQLSAHGAALIVSRHDYVAELCDSAATVHRRLAKDRETLIMRYECSLRDTPLQDEEAVRRTMLDRLNATVQKDIDRKTTQCGPHRDDIALRLGERELRRFASQGQRRSAALALRMGSAEIVRKRRQEAPILALDDALSELDAERRYELLDLAAEMDQVLLTTTDSEIGRLKGLCPGTVYEVSNGEVHQAS